MDKIIPYTCASGDLGFEGIAIVGPATGNMKISSGLGNVLPYLSSVYMIALTHGQERTLKHTIKLFRESGWEIYKIYQSEIQGEFASQIHARPANVM